MNATTTPFIKGTLYMPKWSVTKAPLSRVIKKYDKPHATLPVPTEADPITNIKRKK